MNKVIVNYCKKCSAPIEEEIGDLETEDFFRDHEIAKYILGSGEESNCLKIPPLCENCSKKLTLKINKIIDTFVKQKK